MNKLLNALGFQAGWWACIASVRHDAELQALVFCFFLMGIHLFFSKSRMLDMKLGLVSLLLGILIDSGLQYFSVVSFYGWALGALSPFWLWALWVIFALTLNSSLAFLTTQPLITPALLGLVFGPVTYYAGAKLGAADLEASLSHVLFLAVVWMLAMPFLVMTTRQLSLTTKDNI